MLYTGKLEMEFNPYSISTVYNSCIINKIKKIKKMKCIFLSKYCVSTTSTYIFLWFWTGS